MLDYVPSVFTDEPRWNPYPGRSAATEMPVNLFVREFSLVDQVHSLGGAGHIRGPAPSSPGHRR